MALGLIYLALGTMLDVRSKAFLKMTYIDRAFYTFVRSVKATVKLVIIGQLEDLLLHRLRDTEALAATVEAGIVD